MPMVESIDSRDGGFVTDTTISSLLAGTGSRLVAGSDTAVSGIAYRSDHVHPGDAFFCVRGFAHDGHDYAPEAVARGAVAIVVERPIENLDVTQVLAPDTRVALALGSAAFYRWPSCALSLVGVTGTNGKTTTTYLVDSILRAAGKMTGLIGTVETRIGEERLRAGHTTPESADLEALLARMRDAGVNAVSMEVSSHAIDLRRVDGISFAVAAFTNLTQDHLDYHHTLEEYFSVKRRLFAELEVGAKVVNIDDPLGGRLADELGVDLTVGRHETADVRASAEVLSATGATFDLLTPVGVAHVRLPLAGAFNVSNALVAAGCALSLGIDLPALVRGLETVSQVPGRLERIDEGQGFWVVVDYAHTPDALEKAIRAVKSVTHGRVIVVFGCGGDRDPEKRPLMGAAAGRAADHVVVTSDNPRSEDPVGIILQIEDGLRDTPVSWQLEVDRRSAIAMALSQAVEGDAVLIAGKGHEDYQIFADSRIHFDDREVAREELDRLC